MGSPEDFSTYLLSGHPVSGNPTLSAERTNLRVGQNTDVECQGLSDHQGQPEPIRLAHLSQPNYTHKQREDDPRLAQSRSQIFREPWCLPKQSI